MRRETYTAGEVRALSQPTDTQIERRRRSRRRKRARSRKVDGVPRIVSRVQDFIPATVLEGSRRIKTAPGGGRLERESRHQKILD